MLRVDTSNVLDRGYQVPFADVPEVGRLVFAQRCAGSERPGELGQGGVAVAASRFFVPGRFRDDSTEPGSSAQQEGLTRTVRSQAR